MGGAWSWRHSSSASEDEIGRNTDAIDVKYKDKAVAERLGPFIELMVVGRFWY